MNKYININILAYIGYTATASAGLSENDFKGVHIIYM